MGVRTGPDPRALPRVVTRAEALAAGLTSDQIRQRVRNGRWRTLSVGVYLREVDDAHLDAFAVERVEHVRRCVSAVRSRPDAVIGFGSAAIARALPLVSGVPARPQLIVPEGSWTGIRQGVRYRLGHLDDADVDRRETAVTTPTRTWLDVARTHGLADALSVGDRALRMEMMRVDEAGEALAALGRLRGVRLAAKALPLLDGARETALESWSFAMFVEWGLPLPIMQQNLHDELGLIGRVDFYWPHARLVGEADGRLKYDERGALYAEKRREDRIRAQGLGVVRWSWRDLADHPERLRARLTAALAR